MKKYMFYLLSFGLIFSTNAQTAPGEFWELTSSLEAMGMSMPSQSSKECIPLKDDGNPAGVDNNCKVTDIKRIPNGSTWKMICNDGTTGSGKQTRIKDTIISDILMNTSDGSMKMSMKGKRVGGNCDTGDKMKAVMAEAEKSCNLSNKKAYEVIVGAPNYTVNGALCAGKKEPFCSLVKRELPSDIKAYEMLDVHFNATPDSNIVKACGLNVETARKSLCKANANNKSELPFLDKRCPAEAKILREKIRQEECSGRQFTAASDKAKCMSGIGASGDAVTSPNGSIAPADESTSKSGNVATDAAEKGKKAIKGLKDAFGF
ncbi:MAG: hypothetical protein Q8L73_09785 [Methylotenera sp.]|nr:hypothetical protein [Methylotenera sp.]